MSTQAKVEAGLVVSRIALMAKEDIKRDQDGIRTSLLTLDSQIHNNAVQCLLHAEKHGDTSLMRRLLIETLGGKNGYRKQGIINWMRKHSPMELKGDVINLSGTDKDGNKRPFLIEEADATPFWNDRANDEKVARPYFQEMAVGKIDAGLREFKAALANTLNGQPIDVSKPFWSGIHTDKVVDLMEQIEAIRSQMPNDDTAKVAKARMERQQLDNFISTAEAAQAVG